MNKLKVFLFILANSLWTNSFASDATGAFNKYMSPEGGINPMSATVALQKEIASISVGQVRTSFTLSYSGNIFKDVETQNKDISSGLVGLGWSLGRAQIVCDCKENAFLDDEVGTVFTLFSLYKVPMNLIIDAIYNLRPDNHRPTPFFYRNQ